MYGIDHSVQYVTAHNKDLMNNAELIIQVTWPHIVARVHRFNRIESEEARRREWMDRCKAKGIEYAQVEGLRVYVEHAGALQDVGRTYIGHKLNVDRGEYVQHVLNDMATYMADNLNMGQKYALADTPEIHPDDYYREMRRQAREKRKAAAETETNGL